MRYGGANPGGSNALPLPSDKESAKLEVPITTIDSIVEKYERGASFLTEKNLIMSSWILRAN